MNRSKKEVSIVGIAILLLAVGNVTTMMAPVGLRLINTCRMP